ncbi:hypothetical protein Vafri_9630, partial [Volvox africanus]
VALGPFMRVHNLAPGDKVAVTLSPFEGPMLVRVVRISGFDELGQTPRVKAEKVEAAAAAAGLPGPKDGTDGNSTSTSTSTSGDSEDTGGTSNSCGSSGSSDEDDDMDDRNRSKEEDDEEEEDDDDDDDDDEDDDDYQPVHKDQPSQPTPVTGIKRGRFKKVTGAGASPQSPAPAGSPASPLARGKGGAAAAAVPPEASILFPQKRRRTGGIADGLFDPRCGKVLKDSDFFAIGLSRALYSLDGVFGALKGLEMPLQLTIRTKASADDGARELIWQVWIRARSVSYQLRLSHMGQIIRQFGLATGDVILFAATDDPLTYTITCWRLSASSA